jgi:hypothetical protein
MSVILRFFCQTYFYFMVEPASLRIVHFDITAHPTDAWVWLSDSARMAAGSGIAGLKTSYRATEANAICDRFLGRLREECEPGSA